MNKYFKLCLISVVLLSVLKIIIVFSFSAHIQVWEVHEIALNLLCTGKFRYLHDGVWNYNYQFPIYPCALYILYVVFGNSAIAAVLFNIFLFGITCWLAFSVFIKWLRQANIDSERANKIVFFSILLLQLHPLIAYYTVIQVHPFVMDLFFSLLVLFFMQRFLENRSKAQLLIFGLVFSLALLNRPTLIALAAPLLFSISFNLKKIFTYAVFVLLLSVFPIAWLIRNYVVTKEISMNSSLAQNLWIGTLEGSEGTATFGDGRTFYDAMTKDEQLAYSKMNISQRSSFFSEKYKERLREQPLSVVKMFFVKGKNFWFFRKAIGDNYPEKVQSYIIFYKILYLIVLLGSLASVLYLRRSWIVIFSYPLMLSILQSLVYVETRHRLLIEPMLIFLCMVFVISKTTGERNIRRA